MSKRQITIAVHEEGNALWAEVLEMPGCFATGANSADLQLALEEAIGMYLSVESQPVIAEVRRDLSMSSDDNGTKMAEPLHITGMLARLALLEHEHKLPPAVGLLMSKPEASATITVGDADAVIAWHEAMGGESCARSSTPFGAMRIHSGWVFNWHGWHVRISASVPVEVGVRLGVDVVAELTALADSHATAFVAAQAAAGLEAAHVMHRDEPATDIRPARSL